VNNFPQAARFDCNKTTWNDGSRFEQALRSVRIADVNSSFGGWRDGIERVCGHREPSTRRFLPSLRQAGSGVVVRFVPIPSPRAGHVDERGIDANPTIPDERPGVLAQFFLARVFPAGLLRMNVPLLTVAIVLGVLLALFLVEKFFPLRESRSGLLARLVVNASISLLAFAAAAAVVKPTAMRTLGWASDRPFGLLNLVDWPGWVEATIGFLLLDLSFYYWHLVNHRVPLLWRFHNVHHMDPDLDVSSAFRFHFGEVLFSAGFRFVQVSAIGMSFGTYAAFELVFQANTLFHHSNWRLPIRLERWLNRVLVTPRMHGIHHSQVQGETNSNYGVVFPWWDRLHRTLGLNIPQAAISIGVPAYSLPSDNTLWRTLTLPFVRQRDYWRKPDGNVPERRPTTDRRPTELAE